MKFATFLDIKNSIVAILIIIFAIASVPGTSAASAEKGAACTDCLPETIANRRKVALQYQIMSKLRLEGVTPNVTKEMRDVYRKQFAEQVRAIESQAKRMDGKNKKTGRGGGREAEDEYYVRNTSILLFAERFPTTSASPDRVEFRVPAEVLATKIESASLWIYIRPGCHEENRSFQVFIYEDRDSEPQEVDVNSSPNGGHWTQLDVRKQLSKWVMSKPKAATFWLDIQSQDGCLPTLPTTSATFSNYAPYIKIELAPAATSRNKRQSPRIEYCSESSSSSSDDCCLMPLRINFSEIGWHFIVAPHTLLVNYCTGRCRSFTKGTHGHNTALMHSGNPFGSSAPCCAPTKMGPANILFTRDSHTFVMAILTDIIAEECGCL